MAFGRQHASWTWSLAALCAVVVGAPLGACGSSTPAADGNGPGSGNDASAVTCATAPNGQGCPCSGSATAACGQVTSRNGDYVSCSEGTETCAGGTWGPCVGEYNTFMSVGSVGGTLSLQNLGQNSPDAGGCVTNPCDPSCQGFVDTSTGVDAGGLLPTDAGGWTLPLTTGEGGTCSGLQCNVPICGGGLTTTVKGTVYDPAAINPVYNAVVMIPNGPVMPVPAGVSSDPCGGATLPPAVSYTYTSTTGAFVLTGVPVAASVPLVIQIGRWRRVVNINTATLACGGTITLPACAGTNNYAGTASCQTRLPRTQSEGNIPHIAIATGGLDAIECMLYRMGVSSTEFTDEMGAGRVHVFNDGGATLGGGAANHDLSYLLGFTCPQGNCPTATNTTGITNPDFETGDLTGWTTTGTVAVNGNNPYNGSYSALLGSTGSNNTGTETLAQTFTAPAGATSLEFYVYPHCSQSSNVDNFGAALKDNTANTTASWGTVCINDGNWYTFTAGGIVPGHSYTLKGTNSDTDSHKNYTYVDDVSWLPGAQPPNLAPNYDLIMLPCDGGNEYSASNWGGDPYDDPGRQNLVNYAAVGGRIFTSHWGREWIERATTAIPAGPFPNVATWIGDQQPCNFCGSSDTAVINFGAAWGSPFDTWMTGVGGAANHKFTINPWRYDTSSVSAASRLFVSYQTNGYPADFTFDTPLGAAKQAGRVMYTDMHLANGNPSGTFPGNCPTQGSTLLQQEDAAEYLLFDLGSCVSGLPIPGPATQFNPATFTRDFQGVCGVGTRVVWRNFDWKDSTPGNTNIVFTAWTADTEAQLGAQFPTAASLATASGPDSCPNGPSCASSFVSVNVDPKLGAAGVPASGQPPYASRSWLRVNMTLNPSSDMQTAPSLIAWEQDYDCVASE